MLTTLILTRLIPHTLSLPHLHQSKLVLTHHHCASTLRTINRPVRLEQASTQRVLLSPPIPATTDPRIGHIIIVMISILRIARPERRAKARGQKARHKAAERRHAHAYDTDVEFERGEDSAEDVVVDGVRGVAVLGESPEAGCGYDDCDYSGAEDRDEHNFFRRLRLNLRSSGMGISTT